MIGKGRFVDGFIWNPSICKSECDKSCDIEEYLDYANCNCREKLIVNFGGVATNNGLGRVGGGGGGRFKSGPFQYRKYKRGIKEYNDVSSTC